MKRMKDVGRLGHYEQHLSRKISKADGAIEVLKSCAQTLRENGDSKAADYLDGHRGSVERNRAELSRELRSRLAKIGVSL